MSDTDDTASDENVTPMAPLLFSVVTSFAIRAGL